MPSILEYLTKPLKQNSQDSLRNKRTLNILFAALAVYLLLFHFLVFSPETSKQLSLTYIICFIVFVVLILVFNFRGQTYLASVLFTYALWMRITTRMISDFYMQEHSLGPPEHYIVLIIAGLLLSRSSLIALFSLTFLAWTGFMIAELNGIILNPAGPIMHLNNYFIFLAGLVILVYFLIEHKKKYKIETDLRKSKDMFQSVLDNIPQFVFWKDRNSVYLGCNNNFAAAAGLKNADEIVGKTDYDLSWKKEEADSYRKIDSEVMETNQPKYHLIAKQHRADGKEISIDINKMPILDPSGNVTGILGTSEDTTDRLNAENELKKSEEKYRTLIESLNVGIYRTTADKDGRILHANAEFLKMFGYNSPKELKNSRVVDSYYNPEDRGLIVKELFEKDSVRNREALLKKKDGSPFWCEISAHPVFSDDKKTIKWIDGILQDITTKKQAQQDLLESEEKLRMVVANIPIVLWSIDKDGIFLLSEGKGLEKLGLKPEEVVGKSVFDVYKGNKKILNDIKKALSGKEFYDVLYVGDLIFETWYTPVKDKNGDITGVIGVSTDISEKVSIEKALEKSELNYKYLFEKANDPILIFEPETQIILEANYRAQETYGYKKEEFVGKNLNDLSKDVETGWQKVKELLDGKPSINFESVQYKKDGTPIDFLINSTLIEYKDRPAVFSINRDVTEHKRLLEQLTRHQKIESMGRMAGAVAHDLNHILTGLVTFPDLILMDMDKKDPMRKKIETIKRSGQRASDIVEDLLTIARGGIVSPESIDINEIINECFEYPATKQIIADNPGISFIKELDSSINTISCTRVRVLKLLNNFLSNAAEAIGGDGKIIISTFNKKFDKTIKGYEDIPGGSYVLLSISDSGVGIEKDDLKYIFDPYYTKKIFGRIGSGIGLTVVWNIVKDMDGYIDVKSEQGIGTMFELYLPAEISERTEIDDYFKDELQDIFGDGETILIVDDEESQRILGIETLTRLNYKPFAVSTGEEAVDHVRKKAPDIILLDMLLGTGIDGLDTYKEILKFLPNPKVIIISGYSASERIKEAQKLGAGECLSKPYTVEILGNAIKNSLKK